MNVNTGPKMEARMSTFLNGKCLKITRSFINYKFFEPFKNRVDEKEAPDYYTVIKEPMWLTEVVRKLKSNSYEKLGQYVYDMNLIWSNAIHYNSEGTLYAVMAHCGEYRLKKELQELAITKEDEHLYKLKKYSEQISFYTQHLQKQLDHVPTKHDVIKT